MSLNFEVIDKIISYLFLWSSGIESAANSTENRFFMLFPDKQNIQQTKLKGNVKGGRPTGERIALRQPCITADKIDASKV